METILAALAEQVDELEGLLSRLGEADWGRPSPCPGWTLTDVVLHLAQTDEIAAASAGGQSEGLLGGLGAMGAPAASAAGTAPAGTAVDGPVAAGIVAGGTVDDAAGRAVDAQRGAPGPEVYRRWRKAAADQSAALARHEPGDKLPWVTGLLPARTLATTRLAELWIHTGDVAVSLGREIVPGDRLWHIARLAWRTIPYAFSRVGRTLSGPVAVALVAPDGSTWSFTPDEPALTTVTGPALDFCLVAAQRATAADTALTATGPDASAVLELVRTFA